ncbi:MAG: ribbon-helix-helix protein, CopG family [Acidimicrobiia bacterium]|nr:ribbon-helix-helix protein, CopG family [Acidimicrobiia bacterium]
MIRTQISLTEAQIEAARREAERRGVSLAALIREALQHELEGGDTQRVLERARHAIGGFQSGTSNTSRDHDEVLAESRRW